MDSEEWEVVYEPPNSKFTETVDLEKGKTRIKGLTQQLTARARNYARDVEIDDDIHLNRANDLGDKVSQNLLNEKGERRRKIDDI